MPSKTITPEIKNTLLEVRKRVFGKLNQKRLLDMVGVLDGWSAEKVEMFLQSDSSDQIKEAIGRKELLISSIYAPEGEERTMKLWCLVYGTHEAANAVRESINAFQVPADVGNRNTRLAVSDVSPVRTVSDKALGFSFDLLVRVKALHVVAPGGETFDIATDRALGYGSRHGYESFIQWAFEQTDMEAQVCALLDMEPHIQANQRPRDDFDVGTCGVCTRQFKMQQTPQDVLVNHGYQRPGTGYLIGKCFGVGYLPYELSNQSCTDYIPVLTNMRQKSERLLIHLEKFDGEEHVQSRNPNQRYTVLTPADSRFKAVREAHIRSVKNEIADMAAFESELERRVRDWVPEPEKIRRAGQPPIPIAHRKPKGLGGR